MRKRIIMKRKKMAYKNKKLGRGLFIGLMCLIGITIIIGAAFIVLRPYKITLDLGDGSAPMTKIYTVNAGKIDLGIPKRSGYRFTGWTGSNGTKPQIDIAVGNGVLGNLCYTANWSTNLDVTCQDWIVDKNGNMIREITDEVDRFLDEGGSSKEYTVQKRTVQVKKGTVVSASKWGEDKDYKAYSDKYMYVGASKDVTVNEDGAVLFRYFYPILDVNYALDGENATNNADIAFFDLYVDGELVDEGAYDFCGAIPYGSEYKIALKNVNPLYQYDSTKEIAGKMSDSRGVATARFMTREGNCKVTCEDWVIDASGKRIKEITSEVDKFLAEGKSKKEYHSLGRNVNFSKGDIVSGELWGCDNSKGAYSSGYVYVSSSKGVSVDEKGAKVYRYFYPVLDVNGELNDEVLKNTSKIAKFNVYVDGKVVAENIADFFEGVPYGSEYEINDIKTETGYELLKDEYSGVMGTVENCVDLRFKAAS